ncbi:MoxR family ATPase [Cereibacter johrii]|uniref:ATP-binding protein n=1 Tax=Cereibacter johrii TaxID=445629 RepID=UPI002B25F3AA|nr:MoxR family ATPase [Cereibacter johrii]MEA5160935.1 MoxR family ATPase [Cereibacter johrii]
MTVNTVDVSAGQAQQVLREGWAAQRAGALTTSWMLHGRPGVGKTEIVRQLAAEQGARFYDLRLTTIESQDLRGLPYYDHETKKTQWYRPEDLPDDPDRPSLLFLDELTAAPPHLHPAVYGLLLERRVGPHILPDNVFLVAAGNMVEDGAVAYEMGTALSDRLIHLQVRATASDWLESYAVPRTLHPAVLAFIRMRPDLLETTAEALDRGLMISTTPRSWERVSRIMGAVQNRALRRIMVAGTVGEAVAAEFMLVADDIEASVSVERLLNAAPHERIMLYPESMHGLHALIYGLVGALGPATAAPVIDVMAGIRTLDVHRSDASFARMPLAELCTHGFEMAIRRGLEQGLAEDFLGHPAYAAYASERQAMGLE